MTCIAGLMACAAMPTPAAPLPPPMGTIDDVQIGLVFQHLQRLGADARDEQWLVAGMDVAVAMLAGQVFAVQLGFVEVRAVLDHLAPMPCMAATLPGLAFSGTTMTALTPKRRAA